MRNSWNGTTSVKNAAARWAETRAILGFVWKGMKVWRDIKARANPGRRRRESARRPDSGRGTGRNKIRKSELKNRFPWPTASEIRRGSEELSASRCPIESAKWKCVGKSLRKPRLGQARAQEFLELLVAYTSMLPIFGSQRTAGVLTMLKQLREPEFLSSRWLHANRHLRVPRISCRWRPGEVFFGQWKSDS